MTFAYDKYENLTGAQQDFSIGWSYIDPSEVKAKLDGTEITSFTLVGGGSILRFSPNPVGNVLEIYRETDISEPIVEYSDDTGWLSTDLNNSNLQTLQAVQDARDLADRSILREDTLDFQGVRGENVGDPINATDAANKQYVDGLMGDLTTPVAQAEAARDAAQTARTGAETAETNAAASATIALDAQTAAQAAASGIKWKDSARVATTANITLSGEQTIDGISAVTDDRVLVKDQTTASENGVYLVASGAWTRALPLDTWDEFPSATLAVEEGTANADTAWICTVDQGGTLGVTDITWASLSADYSIQITAAAPPGKIGEFGTIRPPSGWGKCDGGTDSRTGQAALFAAISETQCGSKTSGSAVVTGLSDTSVLSVGWPVSGNGIPASTTVLSVDSGTQVTLSQNCTATETSDIVFAPWGVGDGSTTFNRPDLRSEFTRGIDDGRGIDAAIVLGYTKDSQNKAHTHTGSTASAGSHSHTLPYVNSDGSGTAKTQIDTTSVSNTSDSDFSTNVAGAHTHTLSIDSSGGTEGHPRFTGVLICIKY